MLLRLNQLTKLTFFFSFLLVFSQISIAGDKDWQPISPEELAMKTPKIEADADAEALFWEVYVAD